ncbi:MAG TPA: serine/threonine-protein kinase [Actinomycetota bacterium]|nr:serine/threonine-protein kinase [Actinomycetota bacterium]
MSEKHPSWEFGEGAEIVPGRHAFKRLGGGERYEAYLAWDDHLAALVVVKILRPNSVEDESSLRSLRREARILQRLGHPVVLRCFDAVVEGPRPHLLLEHLEGRTLSVLLRKGPIQIEQLLPLALNISSALHYLAAEGVVHLDVKPSNIVMGIPPRLIDFSIARSVERAQRITSQIGTDAYMAPEQCDPGNRGEIGPPADVWGLGVTLARSILGHSPWPNVSDEDEESDDLTTRFPQLELTPTPFHKSVPALLQTVIAACLERDPSDRPTASEVALAIEPLVSVMPKRPVLGRLRPKLR